MGNEKKNKQKERERERERERWEKWAKEAVGKTVCQTNKQIKTHT